jgi:hypothetical protein
LGWDDPYFSGERGEWAWFVSRAPVEELMDLIRGEHSGDRLWICTFDSGSITPDETELAAGWSVVEGAMVSPPLGGGLEIPCDQSDEWYVFPDASARLGNFERFVSYGGFTLADPAAMAASFDPSWERNGLDWLYPIQERFWSQIDRLRPVSYISTGDNEVIVTRNPGFAASLRKICQ